jgi:putative ABC transport system permease protein
MLITGQFIATIIMIIGTLVIGRQLNFLQKKNLGYDREHIVIIPTNKSRAEGFPLARKLKTELQKNPQVISSAASIFSFSEPGWISLGYDDDKKVFRQFKMNAVDADFVKTMKLVHAGTKDAPESSSRPKSRMQSSGPVRVRIRRVRAPPKRLRPRLSSNGSIRWKMGRSR